MRAFLTNPITHVLAMAVCGAASVVSGVALLAGLGWALIAAGVFVLFGAWYITKGMTPNG